MAGARGGGVAIFSSLAGRTISAGSERLGAGRVSGDGLGERRAAGGGLE